VQLSKLKNTELLKAPSFILVALLFNIAIFILIHNLVNKEHGLDILLSDVNVVDFIRLQQELEPPTPEEEIEDIEEPPPEEEPPPPPEIPQPQIQQSQVMEMDLSVPNIDIPLSLSGTPYLGDFAKSNKGGIGRPGRPKIDTNVVPTLRIPPVYPSRALRSGIEGVVTVEFTIGVDGSVKDPKIVKAKPPKIFDKAVLKAITRWKFNPDMVNGKPVEKRARQDVKFKLQR
jgi:protein TonB